MWYILSFLAGALVAAFVILLCVGAAAEKREARGSEAFWHARCKQLEEWLREQEKGNEKIQDVILGKEKKPE